ncbi:hypothetical protein PINS_up013847 [Pythium insidiosum]|nr:hypothetical protein PINS_up013847 [Pythium insidiosum]
MERHPWHAVSAAPREVEPQLPVGWRWTSDWVVDRETSNCDSDGWNYAFDFTMLNFMVKRNGGRNAPKSTDYVRRRRWIRHRTRVPPPPTNVPKAVPSSDVDNQDDLTIPDALDVDDDEGDDPGDDDDEKTVMIIYWRPRQQQKTQTSDARAQEVFVNRAVGGRRRHPFRCLLPICDRSASQARNHRATPTL